MNKGIKAVTAVALSVGVLVGAGPAAASGTGVEPPVTPFIIGGELATELYGGMGSLQRVTDDWHSCGAILTNLSRQHVLINAHCVTNYPDATPRDPARYKIRFGSNDRLSGGVVVGVKRILPHAGWAWGAGSGGDFDAAVLELDKPLWGVKPFYIPSPGPTSPPTPTGVDRKDRVRAIGWGITAWPGWDGPAPQHLAQLDMRIVDPARCAVADIGVGEICVEGVDPATGICFGDSGGPVLQKTRHGWYRWAALGGFSRETDANNCLGPAVMTDWRYFRSWAAQVIRTGVVPPAPAGAAATSPGPPMAFDSRWGDGPL